MKAEIFLPEDYRPAEDEPFMNERQLEYFRRKLITWKNELLDESRTTVEALQALAAEMEYAGRDGKLDEVARLLPTLRDELHKVNAILSDWQ